MPADRHPIRRSGIRVVRRQHLEEWTQWHLGPPRLRYEEAVVDVAAEADSDFAALAELAKAVQGRRTTADRLLATMARRERVARREWMTGVLSDVRAGTCSVRYRSARFFAVRGATMNILAAAA